jgi:hypothetical protein
LLAILGCDDVQVQAAAAEQAVTEVIYTSWIGWA